MADISQEIQAFLNAKYGEDVRSSMVSAMNKINTVNEDGVAVIESQVQIDEEPTEYTKLKLETTGQDIEVLTADELSEIYPPPPTVNGNYTLKCTVTNGTPVVAWILEE